MTFKGWPVEAIEFFEGLEADNSKTYWQANKDVYERCVRGPMDALLADLSAEFGAPKVFRPYRDTRFAKDKSPYKTNIAATLSEGGYIHLSSEYLGAGCGMWMMAGDQLARYREAVDDDKLGSQLERLTEEARAKGLEAGGHDSLKTAPKGYPRDHPRIELLRAKGFVTWKQWPVGAWLGKAGTKDRIVTFFRDSRPIAAWLDANVGPSTEPPRER